MKKITLFISALCLISSGIFAQNSNRVVYSPNQLGIGNAIGGTSTSVNDKCGMTAHENFLRSKDPLYDVKKQIEMQKMEDAIKNLSKNKTGVYTLPTVVHVVYNTAAENLTDAQVQNMIVLLNDDFRRTNSDAGNTPAPFLGVAADMELEFCLASTDPSGNPTTGILHVSTSTTSFSTNDAVKNTATGGSTAWPNDEYFNIWICDLGGGILGYGEFPSGSPLPNTYGAVSDYCTVPGPAACAPYNLNRTMTHELSHCFNLYHIWGDDGGSCAGSDLIGDTPNQADATTSCFTFPQTDACTPSGDGIMFMNYMDYSFDNCMNMFTTGQKTRAHAAVQTYLSGVYNNTAACSAPALNAEFTASATVINVGQTVTFTDASTGPNTITNWAWDFDVASVGGVAPATANTQGAHVVTYNTVGTFTVSLQVTDNTAANDTETKAAYITVNAAGTPICDSTAANWDWNTETNYFSAYWGPDCNGASPSGFILGNNCYDDNGWASKVTFSTPGKELTDVIYVFTQSIGTGATTLKVWDADGAGFDAANGAVTTAPGTILESQAITSGQYSGQLNQWITMPVSPAVALSGDFYIGYDHPAAPADGDSLTMAVVAGTTGNQTWANEAGIGWRDIAFWGVDYKGTVIAVTCDIATGEKEILGEINEVTVFPNPSLGTINVALTSKVKSTIEIYNVVGKLIYNNTLNTQLITVDVSDQPNGVYFVNIRTGNSVTTKKVLLSK